MTSYLRLVLTTAISCLVFEILITIFFYLKRVLATFSGYTATLTSGSTFNMGFTIVFNMTNSKAHLFELEAWDRQMDRQTGRSVA